MGPGHGCSDQVRHDLHAVEAVGQHDDRATLLPRADREGLESSLIVVAPLEKSAGRRLETPTESPCNAGVLDTHLGIEPRARRFRLQAGSRQDGFQKKRVILRGGQQGARTVWPGRPDDRAGYFVGVMRVRIIRFERRLPERASVSSFPASDHTASNSRATLNFF